MKYHIWTEGCQMNAADSRRLASALEHLGYRPADSTANADVIILNTCVVRQSAENKACSRLQSLRPLKQKNPALVINLMGCMVGMRVDEKLRDRFPFVDVFSPPSDPGPLIAHLTRDDARQAEAETTARRFAWMDEDLPLPEAHQGQLVSAHVPIVLGCSHACSFCIIPYRRGPERSRPAEEIVGEVRRLIRQGVREVTLLGQIVDRYGMDLPDSPDLAGLLRQLHSVEGLERLRFLTSHPKYMSDRLLDAVAELPRVMPHVEVPVQAGDDEVLKNMKRGYSSQEYCELIGRIRSRITDVSIATDVIVGFPGESEAQFLHTRDLLADLRLDVVHLARYSPRPGTVAARRMPDDVPASEKMRRFRLLEELQEGISEQIHAGYLGRTVPVLFEEKVKTRWKGRTPTNKLVFLDHDGDLHGQILPVTITWTGPWSMQSRLPPVSESR